jgi:hypothetical protein
MRKQVVCCLATIGAFFLAAFQARADNLVDFEWGGANQTIPTDLYEPAGASIYGAKIFQPPTDSWLSVRSGTRGMYPYPFLPGSKDGTSTISVLAEHSIPLSPGGYATADISFVVPGTTQQAMIDHFSIGYGYDADGGELYQAVVIEAFNADNQRVLDVVRPNLYYDGYETFSAPGAIRLRLTQNGYVGFDDLSFNTPVPAPEPSTLALLTAGAFGLLTYAWRRRRAS